MSNLVPEKRVDKNGVLVTKHVKPAGALSASKSNIPAPALSSAVTVPPEAPSAADIINQLNKRDIEINGSNMGIIMGYERQLPHIDKFPAEARYEIHSFFGRLSKADFSVMHAYIREYCHSPNRFSAYINTIDDIKRIDSLTGTNDFTRSVQNLGAIYSTLELNLNKGLGEYEYSLIKTDHLANKLNINPESFNPRHRYYAEIEILRSNWDLISPALPVVIAVKQARDLDFVNKSKDPQLSQPIIFPQIEAAEIVEVAEYANQYPDQIDLIADTINERGEFNPDLIDTMLNSGAGAVASGAL